MTAADALPTIAEIAVTLAGFSSLLVVFRPTATSRWTEHELVRIRALITTCVVVLVCALVPFGLAGLRFSDDVSFGVPLAAYGLFNLVYLTLNVRKIMSQKIRVSAPRLTLPVLAISAAVNLVVLSSGLGIFLPFDPGVLVPGLVWGLVAAVVTLLATVTFLTQSAADDREDVEAGPR